MKRSYLLLIVVFLMLTTFAPSRAQDVTEVVTPTEYVTVGVTVDPTIVAPSVPIIDATSITDIGTLIYYLLGAFALGGIVGGAGFAVLAQRLLRNKDALDAMERLVTQTIPLEALPMIHDLALSIQAGGQLLATITDQQENVTKDDS